MDPQTSDTLSNAYLVDTLRSFRMYKKLGDAAMAQVTADADLVRPLDAESNSIATIVKHIGGNLRSRFTDFLTTDGEKPDRDRDGEFELAPEAPPSRAEILQWWESGFAAAFKTIEALTPADLTRTVYIRRESFLVVEAVNRLVAHLAYHVGQIVYVAKHLAGERWTSLSIPRGQSQQHQIGSFKEGRVPR